MQVVQEVKQEKEKQKQEPKTASTAMDMGQSVSCPSSKMAADRQGVMGAVRQGVLGRWNDWNNNKDNKLPKKKRRWVHDLEPARISKWGEDFRG